MPHTHHTEQLDRAEESKVIQTHGASCLQLAPVKCRPDLPAQPLRHRVAGGGRLYAIADRQSTQ